MDIAARHAERGLAAGTMLLTSVLYTLLIELGCFVIGVAINAAIWPAALALSVVTTFCLYGFNIERCKTIVYVLVAIIVSTSACWWLTDNSYDGNAYHGEAIVRLLEGWNPIYEPEVSPTRWVNGYAKALEMCSAAISAFTGNVESGKVINFILAGSALSFVWAAVRRSFAALSNKRVWIVTLLFGANPVLLTQVLTFYNDYALYCCALIVGAMMLLIYREGWSLQWGSIATMATMIGMVTKFTHGFYLGVEWCAFIVLLILSRRPIKVALKCALVAVIGALLGLFILGYHPYITNTIHFGNPFYPLVGANAEDIMTGNTPSVFSESGRIVNFFKSVAMMKWLSYDQRYGGFGPFMAPLLILSLLIVAAMAWRRWHVAYVVLSLILSCFIFEQSWWARYIPFLWAVIPIGTLSSFAGIGKWYRICRIGIYLCVIMTMPLCVVGGVWPRIEATVYRQTLYNYARQSGTVQVAIEPSDVHVRHRLDEAHISYSVVPRECIDTTRAVYLTNDGFRNDIIELSPDAFNEITAPGLRYRLTHMPERTLDFFEDIRISD
jgi:hypothetical protein